MLNNRKMFLWLLPAAVSASLFIFACSPASSPKKTEANDIPTVDIQATYDKLLVAMRSGNEYEIKKMILRDSVGVTRTPRAPGKEEMGRDINLPFVNSKFADQVVSSRVYDNGSVFFIRTKSSYLYFVETKNAGWKLFRYGDKPIK